VGGTSLPIFLGVPSLPPSPQARALTLEHCHGRCSVFMVSMLASTGLSPLGLPPAHVLFLGRQVKIIPIQIHSVRIRALAGDVISCTWARHSTITVPLSTQEYKWLPASLMLRVILQWTSHTSVGRRNTPNCFMLQKTDITASLKGHLTHMQTFL